MFRNLSLIFVISALTLAVPTFLIGSLYLDKPPVAHTGGFGEPTYQTTCHSEYSLNNEEGTLKLSGLPDPFVPGKKFVVNIMLTRPWMQRAGFQMSVRYLSGGSQGKQAGRLRTLDKNIEIDVHSRIQYARHTITGAEHVEADTVRWTME